MKYALSIRRRAQKGLVQLPTSAYESVRDAIKALSDKPRPAGCRKLTGRDGWRIKIGDYRVIYEIDDKQHRITILHVGHRRDVYR